MAPSLVVTVLTSVIVLQLGCAFRPHGLMRQTRNPTMILPDYPPPGERRNYPRPDFEGTSVAQREARDFSNSFNYGVAKNKKMKVAIIGGNLTLHMHICVSAEYHAICYPQRYDLIR